jgi:hypothetical protein
MKAKQKSKTGKRQTKNDKNMLNNKNLFITLQPTPGFNTT